jgi:hypothetical protein
VISHKEACCRKTYDVVAAQMMKDEQQYYDARASKLLDVSSSWRAHANSLKMAGNNNSLVPVTPLTAVFQRMCAMYVRRLEKGMVKLVPAAGCANRNVNWPPLAFLLHTELTPAQLPVLPVRAYSSQSGESVLFQGYRLYPFDISISSEHAHCASRNHITVVQCLLERVRSVLNADKKLHEKPYKTFFVSDAPTDKWQLASSTPIRCYIAILADQSSLAVANGVDVIRDDVTWEQLLDKTSSVGEQRMHVVRTLDTVNDTLHTCLNNYTKSFGLTEGGAWTLKVTRAPASSTTTPAPASSSSSSRSADTTIDHTYTARFLLDGVHTGGGRFTVVCNCSYPGETTPIFLSQRVSGDFAVAVLPCEKESTAILVAADKNIGLKHAHGDKPQMHFTSILI